MVRYSRKTGEQYLMSEQDGKATGWRAVYRDGRWVEPAVAARQPAMAPAKKAG